LIGRERDLGQVRERLAHNRLVTLTGPGGTGKTRLALAVAQALAEESPEAAFPDGIWLVELGGITDADGVAPAVAQALNVPGEGPVPATERLKAFLRARHTLLVLDNFEQVLPAAPLVRELLQSSAGLRVLVTSQAVLHLAGEHEYPVLPLGLPGSDATSEETQRSPAVTLFVQRAQAVRDDFTLGDEQAPAVAAICTLLDGLPLAIELAAARVKLLPPTTLLQRLQHGLQILAAGDRSLPERLQTLRGAMHWSYALLSAEEHVLFRRLGVFAGGCTLEAVEAVCNADGTLDVFAGLASLVDKSLVQQRAAGEPRFTLLNVVRAFAREELAAAGELEQTQIAHARYFHAIAAANSRDWSRHRDANIAVLEPELDNFRAVFAWAAAGGDLQLGLDTIGLLHRFPAERNWLESGSWAQRLVALDADKGPTLARGRGLVVAASAFQIAGDVAGARPAYAEAIEILRGHPEARSSLIQALAMSSALPDEHAQAIDLAEEAVSLARDLSDPYLLALALLYLGGRLRRAGAWERSSAALQELRGITSPLHSLAAVPYRELGTNALAQRDFAGALPHLYEARERARGYNSVVQATVLIALGTALVGLARQEEAETTFAQALRIAERGGLYTSVSCALQGLASVAEGRGDHERSAQLFGAAGATRASVPPGGLYDELFRSARAASRAALGDERFQQLCREGEALELAEVMRSIVLSAWMEGEEDGSVRS
jgi:predicted ATPase